MDYENLSLRFERSGGEYPLVVAWSGSGAARGRFGLTFHEVAALAGGQLPATRDLSARAGEAAKTPTHQQLGALLYRSLFSGPPHEVLQRTRGRAEALGAGLRIEIELNLDDPELANLGRLPWELLYDEGSGVYLFRADRRVLIVRTVPVLQPVSWPAAALPLGVLVALSSPAGFAPLDVARERERIENGWAGRKDVRISFLERAGLKSLRNELLRLSPWVVHFVGHGGLEPATGEGFLVLEDESGGPHLVPGRTLADQLSDRSAGLVILNACQTASQPERGRADPFAGVATALVRAGLPAVVAMQRQISDRAAIAFSGVFYQRLAAGDPVATAMAEARLALASDDRESHEWSTPVLYVRSREDRQIKSSEDIVDVDVDVGWAGRILAWRLGGLAIGRAAIWTLGFLAWFYLGVLMVGIAANLISGPFEGRWGSPVFLVPSFALFLPALYAGIRCHRALRGEIVIWTSAFILGCFFAEAWLG